jgi:hypothetical protein
MRVRTGGVPRVVGETPSILGYLTKRLRRKNRLAQKLGASTRYAKSSRLKFVAWANRGIYTQILVTVVHTIPIIDVN